MMGFHSRSVQQWLEPVDPDAVIRERSRTILAEQSSLYPLPIVLLSLHAPLDLATPFNPLPMFVSTEIGI